jgi:hypothetical protein
LYDAHMWAYAEHYGLSELYSEDFEHNRLYGSVRAVNPFVAREEEHMRIGELADWPPEPGGSYSHTDWDAPSGYARLKEVIRVQGDLVTFTVFSGNHEATCDFRAAGEGLAKKLADVLRENTGKTLTELGGLEL